MSFYVLCVATRYFYSLTVISNHYITIFWSSLSRLLDNSYNLNLKFFVNIFWFRKKYSVYRSVFCNISLRWHYIVTLFCGERTSYVKRTPTLCHLSVWLYSIHFIPICDFSFRFVLVPLSFIPLFMLYSTLKYILSVLFGVVLQV